MSNAFLDTQPPYWAQAVRELRRADPVLKKIIDAYPKDVGLSSRGDPFGTLLRSIVGQQISVKAADSIWKRVVGLVPDPDPKKILRAPIPKLRACGLSARKVEYMRDLASHFHEGKLKESEWEKLDDEAIIQDLIQVRGIGRWTAEMFLIFTLLRPDIFPLADIGLQKAIFLHYFKGRKVQMPRLAKLGEEWQPWRSVATWYLWRSLDPVPVEY